MFKFVFLKDQFILTGWKGENIQRKLPTKTQYIGEQNSSGQKYQSWQSERLESSYICLSKELDLIIKK